MIGKKLKQKLCIAGAFGMMFLSLGITPVYAVDDSGAGTAIDPAADHTAEQYYFASENGVTVPGWNTETANISADKKIVVAVVGSGVDYNHDDLKNVMWNEGDTIESLKTMGGGKYGYNADGITAKDNTVSYDDPMDTSGEGTQIAGILAAEWNNAGISGALSGAQIMAVKTTGSNTAAGLKYVLAAKKAGVNVAAVNLSLSSCTSETENLITELGEAGVVTVIAAGDQGKDIDSGTGPAAALRNNPYVITVGATDSKKELWSGSNYGTLNCTILAPGENILTTDITKIAETKEETAVDTDEQNTADANNENTAADIQTADNTAADPAETIETTEPVVSQNYSYVSSTSAASAIVTAAVTLMYDADSTVKADVRAAKLLQTADQIDGLEEKSAVGFLDLTEALDKDAETAPLVNYAEIKDDSVVIHGYDLGSKRGTVKVDDEKLMASSWVWKDNSITAKTDSVSGGVHTVEITRSGDDQTATRDINVVGDKEETEEISTEGIAAGFVATAITIHDGKKFLFGYVPGNDDTNEWKAYSYDAEQNKWISYTITQNTEDQSGWFHDITDACSDNGTYLYLTREDGTLLQTKPVFSEQENKFQLKLISMRDSFGADARIASEGTENEILICYTETDGEPTATRVVIERVSFDNPVPLIIETATISESDLKCLDLIKTGNTVYPICVRTLSSETQGEQLAVFKIDNILVPVPEVKELFTRETQTLGTYSNAGAVSNGEVISVYRKTDKGAVLEEYAPDATGKQTRSVEILNNAPESICGDIDTDGTLYIAGNTKEAEEGKQTVFVKGVETGVEPKPTPSTDPGPAPSGDPKPSEPPTPTPTTTPTATPTPAPTEEPKSEDKPAAPTAEPAQGSTVVTCQDAGFPAGWYWDESKKACVAPAAAAPANNGNTANNGTNTNGGNRGNGTNTNGNSVVPGNNNANNTNGTADDAEATAEPTETPEVTATPTATPEEAEKTEPPIEIVNTKGILWFLGIPVLMILAGLGIFFAKNKGLIPWILAADAIGSVALAILDHSVVGWILLVLNLAAVGLLVLYRSGKQDEEEDFDEDDE